MRRPSVLKRHNKVRIGPRSKARFKPEVHPPRSKLSRTRTTTEVIITRYFGHWPQTIITLKTYSVR